ncbi:oligosaccharide flippase family protein [Sulfurovum sp.]|uniref:oligosaccharide flippase family protein n=1 Tax=Sulfurovum sp. TaxID=1969726 RepID=UPI0035658384
MSNKTFSKQLPLNLITNIAVFILSTIIGLFMTPFLIKYIGIEGFGVIRLALAIPVYVGLSMLLISGAVSRFLTIDLQRNDLKAANKTFNTAFFGMFGISLLLLPIVYFFSFNINIFFSIPTLFKEDAVFLFLGILLSSLVTVFSAMFMIPTFANNRLDINNFVRIGTLTLQTVLMIALVYWFTFPLTSVGLAHLVAAILGLIISLKIWKRFSPSISIDVRLFSLSKFKELAFMGSWLIIDQVGTILFLYVDLLVVNYVFGASATGEYSIPLQWQTMLRSLASVLAGVIAPMILISYARGEFDKLRTLSYSSVKFLGLALAIPIGLICGFAPVLLTLWVGEEFLHLVPLLWLMLIPMGINLALVALFPINTAFNKIKIPAYVTLFTGAMNVLLALLLTMQFDMGLYGVALAGAISFTTRNLLFTVLYTAKVAGSNPLFYYKNLFFGTVAMLAIFALSYYIQSYILIESWSGLLVSALFILVLSAGMIYKFMFNSSEKNLVDEMLLTRVKKMMNRKEENL